MPDSGLSGDDKNKSDFSDMLERNYQRGIRKHLEDLKKQIQNEGQTVNDLKLNELRRNRESFNLVKAVELAAREFMQKKQRVQMKQQTKACLPKPKIKAYQRRIALWSR